MISLYILDLCVLKHGKHSIFNKNGVTRGGGIGVEGDLQLILYRELLVVKRIAFPCYKTPSVFLYMTSVVLRKTHTCSVFVYDICGSSEHCKPLLAYVLSLIPFIL